MWKALAGRKVRKIASETKEMIPLLAPNELNALKNARDPSALMWMWIACLIARCAQHKWLPPMESPVYGRIMNICQSAHSAIREVRTSVSIQTALVYTHFMATIVHIQNILNAVCLGLVGGIGIGTWMVRRNYHFYDPVSHTSRQELHQDFQNIAVTTLYCVLGPLLFHALLLISMDVSQPFESQASAIPVDQLLRQLEIDLNDCRHMLDHCNFERPYFKEAPPPPPSAKNPQQGASTTSSPRPVFEESSGTDVQVIV